ncbi:MAG: hypothetical protein NVS4B3_02930 [Gemmatimonadaceae bacterium]
MPNSLLRLVRVALVAAPLSILAAQTPQPPQTADEIIARYIKTIGGVDKVQAVKTLRRTGRFTGDGGFQAVVVQENKRPTKIRQEFSLQGMTGVNAYDGRTGWKIEPWQGKKDPEPLGEEEMHQILEDSDFDDPLINYREKGNTVEFVGTDQIEGTDVYKLKLTHANGDVRTYYMDSDYFVPIKLETKQMIRGAEQEAEVTLGDYKEVNGWYLPFSLESNQKGSSHKQKITIDKIDANVDIDDGRFALPTSHAVAQQPGTGADASTTPPAPQPGKPAATAQPPAAPSGKPPLTRGD